MSTPSPSVSAWCWYCTNCNSSFGVPRKRPLLRDTIVDKRVGRGEVELDVELELVAGLVEVVESSVMGGDAEEEEEEEEVVGEVTGSPLMLVGRQAINGSSLSLVLSLSLSTLFLF